MNIEQPGERKCEKKRGRARERIEERTRYIDK